MPRNIEIKARLTREEQYEIISRLDDPKYLEQVDTFFNVPNGRLKLREVKGAEAELIFYDRPNSSGPKVSDYDKSPVSDPTSMKAVLSSANGVKGILKKVRQLNFVGQTRVHFDTVEGLGKFVEFEVVLQDHQSVEEGQKIATELMKRFKIEPDDLISCAYVDMLYSE